MDELERYKKWLYRLVTAFLVVLVAVGFFSSNGGRELALVAEVPLESRQETKANFVELQGDPGVSSQGELENREVGVAMAKPLLKPVASKASDLKKVDSVVLPAEVKVFSAGEVAGATTPVVKTASARDEKTVNKKPEPKKKSAEVETTWCSFAGTGETSDKTVIFNEVAWMGSSASANYEWFEIANRSGASVALAGWQVQDVGGQIKIEFPAVSLPAGAFLLLERSEEAVPELEASLLYSGALSNSGEELRLFTPTCQIADAAGGEQWPAGENSSRKSMERGADLSWHTFSGSSAIAGVWGTPAGQNSNASQESIVDSQEEEDSESEEEQEQEPTVYPPAAPVEGEQVEEPEPETPEEPEPVAVSGCVEGQVDINTASLEELQKIIGVGPATAPKIIDARPFSSVEDLVRVSGIAEGRLVDILEQGLACVE
ncbi:MAG: hypothetical protein COU11_03705 [Candidatus Harrisonbacteria bacterium CG10_big_fil_rev_8_21_14_0_10_49_15]|uniref:LTD domain-containing protein n=1 Tax=Candidatus Harrisonbacteria bacterium CG10_big_fil_rev_8_21_14_0_10_49_15 TaxID=1974587 RepID=A0A2H0UK49_9BACT|nr:MAG: hypothetical protein COU11_03705 [Candidatus Harrisonbacteria bacterium CG10_big_fil_rev_8_21_14_0_10_49_15]